MSPIISNLISICCVRYAFLTLHFRGKHEKRPHKPEVSHPNVGRASCEVPCKWSVRRHSSLLTRNIFYLMQWLKTPNALLHRAERAGGNQAQKKTTGFSRPPFALRCKQIVRIFYFTNNYSSSPIQLSLREIIRILVFLMYERYFFPSFMVLLIPL